MSNNNPSQNTYNSNIYESNSDIISDTHTQVPYGNNVNNQQPMLSNNGATISPDHNRQQYNTSSNVPPHYNDNYQQPISDISLDNNVTISPDHDPQRHDASSNIPYHDYQQSTSNTGNTPNTTNTTNTTNTFNASNTPNTLNASNTPNTLNASNNASLPQFYSPQSNVVPWLNSIGITINSPNATIIIIPTTNPDFQNQLQQVLNSSTNNSHTRSEQ